MEKMEFPTPPTSPFKEGKIIENKGTDRKSPHGGLAANPGVREPLTTPPMANSER